MQVNSLCTNFLKKAENCYCILYTKCYTRSIKTAPHLALLVRAFFYPFLSLLKIEVVYSICNAVLKLSFNKSADSGGKSRIILYFLQKWLKRPANCAISGNRAGNMIKYIHIVKASA